MITPNITSVFPVVESTILGQDYLPDKKIEEPIDLSKSLKRLRQSLYQAGAEQRIAGTAAKETVKEQIEKNKDKLIVILFNSKYIAYI